MTLYVGKPGISGTGILRVGLGVSVGGGGGQPQPFVGPYDAIPSIAALYAMRRALSDYTDALIRVRRDSDNEEQDIGYTASGDLDTAALASWLGEANGYITTWYDQSGNGNHAAQSTAAAQPLLVLSGQNGKPVVRLDGVNDYLATGIVPTSTVSAVVRYNVIEAVSARYLFAAWQAGNRLFGISPYEVSGTVVRYGYADGSYQQVAPPLLAGVLAVTPTGGYRSGAREVSWSAPNLPAVPFIIGGLNNDGTPQQFINASIHEMLVGNVGYDDTQIAAITDIMEVV